MPHSWKWTKKAVRPLTAWAKQSTNQNALGVATKNDMRMRNAIVFTNIMKIAMQVWPFWRSSLGFLSIIHIILTRIITLVEFFLNHNFWRKNNVFFNIQKTFFRRRKHVELFFRWCIFLFSTSKKIVFNDEKTVFSALKKTFFQRRFNGHPYDLNSLGDI